MRVRARGHARVRKAAGWLLFTLLPLFTLIKVLPNRGLSVIRA